MEDIPFYRRPVVIVPVLLTLVGVGVWFVFFRDRVPNLSSEGAKDMAERFLTEVRTGRVDAAWETTSSDFKSMYGRDRFRGYVRSKPMLKSTAEFEKCEFKSEGPLRLAECTFRLGGKSTITIVLHPDQGNWKVGRFNVE